MGDVTMVGRERLESFASLLAQFRRERGLTQDQLAHRSGLSVRAISSLECEARHPRRYTVERLAVALELGGDDRATLLAAAASGRRPPPTPPTRLAYVTPEGPLVGRADEIAELRAHLSGRGPALLAYEGEPGIGKSRLLGEAVQIATSMGMRVLAAGAHRDNGAYSPLVDAFADHIRQLSPGMLAERIRFPGLELLIPELTGKVPALPYCPPEQARRLTFEVAVQFIESVAVGGPTALILDDLQWDGPHTADLLAHLVRACGPSLRVVVAYRPGEVRLTGRLAQCAADLARHDLIRRRPLSTLSTPDARAVVEATAAGSALSAPRHARVLRLAGGLPLFLVELTQAAICDGADEVPWSLKLMVAHQIAALAAPVADLVRKLAADEVVTPAERLAGDGIPIERVMDDLESARRSGLIDFTRRGFRFRYPLVREILTNRSRPTLSNMATRS
jgi:transcriptional regulator with XRE-family HTH domain